MTYEAEVWMESANGYIPLTESYDYESIGFESSPIFYESVRVMLDDQYGMLSDEQVSLIVHEAKHQMTAAEFKFFKKIGAKIGKGLKKFGKKAIKFGRKALPVIGKVAQIAGPIVGTIFGGPAGAKLGAKIGGLVNKGAGFLSKLGKGRMPRISSNIKLAGAANLLAPKQPATNQLLGLLQNPALMQSLLGKVLGGSGAVQMATPRRGGQSNVNFGSFMNLLGQLSTQAAIEANGQADQAPTYLQDQYGNFLTENIHDEEERAEVLLEVLYENTINNYAFDEYETTDYDPLTEWFVEAGMVE